MASVKDCEVSNPARVRLGQIVSARRNHGCRPLIRGRADMGINNRQRRAAKRLKRNKQGAGRPNGAAHHTAADTWYGDVATQMADIVSTVIQDFHRNRAGVAYFAHVLIGGAGSSIQSSISAPYIMRVLTQMMASVVRSGWLPSDIAEVSRRKLTQGHVPLVAHALRAEVDRHRHDRVARSWLADLARLGHAETADLRTIDGMERALGLVAVLGGLPPIPTLLPPPGAASSTDGSTAASTDARMLSRVRSLLAKAESTDYPEEAEALSQKAQELMSRYALERLLHRLDDHAPNERVTARRFWIDGPYVFAKGTLVGVVARANRCRSVIDEELGFVTLFGEATDLDPVELLATSLLVQANSAMLRHGRHYDFTGTSRTTSFRRSFMTSYAQRIGERLAEANHSATTGTARAGELVPLLQGQAERIDAAVSEMFPETIMRRSTVTNAYGWAAGRAAADAASLDVRQHITQAAS
jgi:hypothetical protein